MNTLEQRLENIEKIVEYLEAIESASLKEIFDMFLGRITNVNFQHAIQLGLDKGSFDLNHDSELFIPEPLDRMEQMLVKMKYAYTYGRGGNPAGENAYYHCSHCDLELHGKHVGYVSAGSMYANGEHSKCPRCGEENPTERDYGAWDV